MRMTPTLRKLSLTAHITSSLGWLGAVIGFLVLSIAGRMSRDAEIVRSAYLAMRLIGAYAIVPLSLAALLTGIVQALATPWGLYRYYWVLVKLVLTLGATLLLLLHQYTAVRGAAQRIASTPFGAMPDVGRWGTQLVGDATAAVAMLVAITCIAVFKPWGPTRFSRRRSAEVTPAPLATAAASEVPASLKLVLVAIGVVIAAFLVLHLARGGMHQGH